MEETNTTTFYIEEIKKAVNEILGLVVKQKYAIEVAKEDGVGYILVIDNNNSKIFRKEIKNDEYENIKKDIDKYNIAEYYFNEIKKMLEKFKEKKIIEEYFINISYYSANLTSTVKKNSADIYISMRLRKELLEKIKKEGDPNDYIIKVLTIGNGKLNITKSNITVGVEVDDDKAIYTTKEGAEEIIKQYSK